MSKIRIRGWTAAGFRCPDHQISLLSKRKPHRVSLLQMPNGTGKTTTLRLIRAAMCGRAGTPDELHDLRRKNGPKTGAFTLSLDVDNKQLTIELKVNFADRTAKFRTTYGGASKLSFSPPSTIQRALTPELVQFYVFDGELAARLLNPQLTRAQDAVDAQFRLAVLHEAIAALERYWTTKGASKASKVTGLTRRRNLVLTLRAREAAVLQERAQLESQHSRQRLELEDARRAYEDVFNQDRDAREQREALGTRLADVETRLEAAVLSTIAVMHDPHALMTQFATDLQRLRDNLDKLKLPESAAKEFFDDLAEASHCVCGESMTDARRANLLVRRDQYLGQDDAQVVNMVKGQIKSLVSEDASTYRSVLDREVNALDEIVRERDLVVTDLTALEGKRLAAGDSLLIERNEALQRAEATFAATQERINVVDAIPTGDEDVDTDCLAALARLRKDAEDDFAEITQTRTIKKKTGIIKKIIDDAVALTRERVATRLVQQTNARLERIVPRSPFQVSHIKQSISLHEQSDASTGQTLALGYAFLLALFDEGQLDLPFVVDSPTGALDLSVRRDVAQLLPKLAGQVVAFTTSSETNQFVPALDKAADGDVQYLTMFRLNDATEPLVRTARPKDTTQFDEAVLVQSRAFFESFDTEKYDERRPR